MYIPSHLQWFCSNEFYNNHKENIKSEFLDVLSSRGLTFDGFERRLNKVEKAIFFKIGFTSFYYIKKIDCDGHCERQTTQFRFLACVAVIESLLGNAKRRKLRKSKKGRNIYESLVVTFLVNNLPIDEKEKLSRYIFIKRRGKEVKSLEVKLRAIVNMRNGFMHRAELIRIPELGGIVSYERGHKGRKSGIISVSMTVSKFMEFIKSAIVSYLLQTRERRKPLMNHRIYHNYGFPLSRE